MKEDKQTETRIYIDKNLLKQVRAKYPETVRMRNTPLIDWVLRTLLYKKLC